MGSEGINRTRAKRVDTITTVPRHQVHQNCQREPRRPASIQLKLLFETKELVVVAPEIAKQNNVSDESSV